MTRSVLSCFMFFLLLVAVGALGDDGPGEHLTDNTPDYIAHIDLTYEYSTDLAHSGDTVFSLAEDNVCYGLWDYPWCLPWMHQATVTGNSTFNMGMLAISLMGPSCHRTFSNIPNLFVAYIEQSPRVVDNLSIIFLFGILLAISVGASAIARRNSPRGIKRRKILAKKHRSRLLAVCTVTRRAIHDAQQSVPVDAHGLSSTFFTTDYLKLVWTTLCRSWTIKRLEADQQRLLAKVASLSKEISAMKKQIYPEKPRRWQRLARSRGSPERKAEDSASDGPAINLPACSSLASRRSSPHRPRKDSFDGVFHWVLLRSWPVLFFMADCAGILRHQQLLCSLLDIVSAWYLLDDLRTLLEWTYIHEDPDEAMFDRVAFSVPTTVLLVVGAGVTILMHLRNVTNAEPRRVQPRKQQVKRRNAHPGSGGRVRHAQHSPATAVAAGTSATATAEATSISTATGTAEVTAITTATAPAEATAITTAPATAEATAVTVTSVAAHTEMGGACTPVPLTVGSATAATEQIRAYAGKAQDDQPTAVIAWMKSLHVTTTDSLRADRDQHAAESTELANRLSLTAAIATASDSTTATFATKASADRAASAAAKLALEEVKDNLSNTAQDRDRAHTTAGDLAKQLAATTAAANIKIEEAHRRESAVREEMEARQREYVEAPGIVADLRKTIAGLHETIAVQSAVATTTAAELELARQMIINATSAETAVRAERDDAIAAATAASVAELARVTNEAARATAMASIFARERDNLGIELRAALEDKSTAATTAANDLAAAATTAADLRDKLEVQTNFATTAQTALAAAQQEFDRATSSAVEAAAGRLAAENERDAAVAAGAAAAVAEVARVTKEAAHATAMASMLARERDTLVIALRVALEDKSTAATTAANDLAAAAATASDLRAKLEVQTTVAITAQTALAAAQQEAAASRQQEEVHATAATTAKAALAAAQHAAASRQQEVDRATSSAIEAAARCHAAESERNHALAATAKVQAEREAQAAAATTAEAALAAAQQEAAAARQQEAARTASWANEANARCHTAESERDRALAATAKAQQEIKEQATTTANELAASAYELAAIRGDASRTVSYAKATEHKLAMSEQERCRVVSSFEQMQAARDQAIAAANHFANQLAVVQVDRDRAVQERESIVATAAEMQAVLDGMHFKRGTLALEEINAAATVTGSTATPNAEADRGAKAARKKTRHSPLAPGREVNEASAASAASTAAPAAPATPAAPTAVVPNLLDNSPFGPPTSSERPGGSMSAITASPIICFYRDGGRSTASAGGEGLSLPEIFEQSDHWLETTHNYIQWVFPTTQASQIVADTPVLSNADLVEIKREGGNPQRNMVSALGKMLVFYGLRMVRQGDEVLVVEGGNFDPEAKWMRSSDHNALRLTRMITSLRLFELGQCADALRLFLWSRLGDHPSQRFWQNV